MQRNLVIAAHLYALPLLAGLSACSNMSPDQQARMQQALTVACNVDGVMVPIAQPIVATIGTGGATAANVDSLLVHPAVVLACKAMNGTPETAVPVSPAVTVPGPGQGTPTN
jgi:hypothetical protein